MKTCCHLICCLEISLFLMLFIFPKSYSQTELIGNWEGTFMNNFKAVVHFTAKDQSRLGGNIKMFSGESKIQDDQINEVSLSGNQCSFFIPAKETTFEGNFNREMNRLSGDFIFPDGSRHAIQLTKGNEDPSSVQENKEREAAKK